jgi:L-lactate dehydrogenase complex protein LldG
VSGRSRILERIRRVLETRERAPHPGPFEGARPEPAPAAPSVTSPLEGFEAAFRAAGGECVRAEDSDAVRRWLAEAVPADRTLVVGEGVPTDVVPDRGRRSAEDADVALSLATGAVAETGTIVLNARDGRRAQLLAPSHLILVPADTIRRTLRETLAAIRGDLPSAFGLHSGPSKSADIGQVMVRGVHGPGTVTAVIYGSSGPPAAGRPWEGAP